MRINKIHINNFRNFKDYEINFGKETTIIIGKNGMGKTNLITAIKQSLSFIFSKKKEELQYDFIASSDQKIESFSVTDGRYCNDGGSEYDYKFPISIKVEADIPNSPISWKFYNESSTSGLNDSMYKDANAKFWNYYINNKEPFPVFAYFSDSYPHLKTNVGKKIQEILDSGNEPPRNIAYYKWSEEATCTEIWVQYFTMQWKNHIYRKDNEKKDYIDSITNKMIEFSKPVSGVADNNSDLEITDLGLEARGKKDVLIVSFKNGDRIPFNELPQGYKRIFSITFDIANRSYILNKNCDPTGIVIIDELELHLHPSIAQEILKRLTTTFKNIQFIVSTHSPLVITNFKQNENNILYKLYKEEGKYKNVQVEDLYGIDYNSGLKYSMDTPERDSHVQELLEAYNYWKIANNAEMITRLKEKIKEAVGEDSELYRSL